MSPDLEQCRKALWDAAGHYEWCARVPDGADRTEETWRAFILGAAYDLDDATIEWIVAGAR